MNKNLKREPKKNHTSQAVGLDIALSLANFITGKDNLHYGLWDNLEINLGNLGLAQDAYTKKLLSYLPKKRNLSILDIGGGAGETAKLLLDLGHKVTIIVPSPILASRSKENTKGKATINLCTFEDYNSQKNEHFDICFFSESFQYIPLKEALAKASRLLGKNGQILIADCFRSDKRKKSTYRPPGGGHFLTDMYKEIKINNLSIIKKEEITTSVSPSIDVEQNFYKMLGIIITRVTKSYSRKHPFIFKIISNAYKLFLNSKKRGKLHDRLYGNLRNSEIFEHYNHYMIFLLKPNN